MLFINDFSLNRKRIIISLFSFFICCLSFLEAKVHFKNHFESLLDYVTSQTLVVLDIDDTLLVPKQMLGTDAWFLYRLKMYLDEGLSKNVALDKALSEWEAIRHLTKVCLIEENIPEIIEQLQNRGVTVMGLTTQGLALATHTVNQLKSLEIDLSRTAPSKSDYYFQNGHGVLYRDGILFTSGTHKGKAFLQLLDHCELSPSHVLFINDKATHIAELEKSVTERDILFTGIRYGFSDERIANFNPDIANIQWNYSSFGHILSDDEARIILESQ